MWAIGPKTCNHWRQRALKTRFVRTERDSKDVMHHSPRKGSSPKKVGKRPLNSLSSKLSSSVCNRICIERWTLKAAIRVLYLRRPLNDVITDGIVPLMKLPSTEIVSAHPIDWVKNNAQRTRTPIMKLTQGCGIKQLRRQSARYSVSP